MAETKLTARHKAVLTALGKLDGDTGTVREIIKAAGTRSQAARALNYDGVYVALQTLGRRKLVKVLPKTRNAPVRGKLLAAGRNAT